MFVHEFGHFMAAKQVGVLVETFSIGMGPKLLKKKHGDTEYCLSAIPLGGYVKLKGENPDETPTGASDELMSKTIPARFAIFVSGPLMNILLAVILVSAVFFMGIQQPRYLEEPPVIEWVSSDSPAQKAGLQIGDLIRSIGGRAITTWEQAEWLISASGGKPLEIALEREKQARTVTVQPTVEKHFGIADIGIEHAWQPMVTGLVKGYPAEQAGVQAGDAIVALNGTAMPHWLKMVEFLRDYPPNQALQLSLRRNGQQIDLTLTPKIEGDRKLLGISSERQAFQPTAFRQYGLVESLERGSRKCWEITLITIDSIRGLITRQVSPKTLGGPIMIAQLTGEVVRQGVPESLLFIGFVSLSLGIVNLLPIPILDGGHIFLLLVEFLNRKPLSLKKREIAQFIGLLILIPLFIFIFYNDIARIIGW